MAESQFGGRISIQAAGFNLSPTEADIKINTSPLSKEAKANQDGSPCYMLKTKLRSAEFSFRRPVNVDPGALLLLKNINVTIVEEDNGRTHLFSGCQFTGDSNENLSSGEVDGLKVEGGIYTRIGAA